MFRHQDSARLAHRCEELRGALSQRWLGVDEQSESWQPKCAVVVHADVAGYGRVFGPGISPSVGCTTITADKERIVFRRIDLRADAADWRTNALPHELTHVVTMYPSAPSWITEGVADFVRSKLTGDAMQCHAGETFADGYGCAATLLAFVERKRLGAIRKLHAELREVAFAGRIAGRDVEAWWSACRADGACRQR